MKLATVKEKVLKLLQESEQCRESDECLIARIWTDECLNHKEPIDPFKITAFDFLRLFSIKSFSSAESIRRSRQKYQELMPELRGKNYQIKQAEQAEVKQELKEFT